MEILQATFISSVADLAKCPPPDKPEFAFIGRSNVGKSSLINMLANRKQLAKTSNKPGKTQTINHFIINDIWYLVDLPGYGYASVSKSLKAGFGKIIDNYVLKRENLDCLFVLLDARLEPQKIDLSFLEWAGTAGVPIALIFTKSDKLSANELSKTMKRFKDVLTQYWEEVPPSFITSAETKRGQAEVLNFIDEVIRNSQENK
ncbi:YihA family ribosome biogenesis GTP-binding protein [Chryseotalea sanaruensis]|uniref:Probable GTP-binding protein EngB n=1 Tax=Chryseotalea sanaruensis TaxID=2482724 RepID=A0A401U5T2_9BACT|nr:ribosome biogenesis GTP-binding protein YihA/YsxC [Chryseotalea sanaruensis]GCC50146.1 YihA family ribosome biogenesis GTP-binding protein [Chryseotalea sanaruensis]